MSQIYEEHAQFFLPKHGRCIYEVLHSESNMEVFCEGSELQYLRPNALHYREDAYLHDSHHD